MPSTGSLKSPLGLPSLRQVKEAGTVSLTEISRNLPQPLSSSDSHTKGKRRDWLTLLVRESLGVYLFYYPIRFDDLIPSFHLADLCSDPVDLKYLTHTQIVEIVYEGHTRQFSVVSVSSVQVSRNQSADDLEERFGSLSVRSEPQVWTVGWDSCVRILEGKADRRSEGTEKVHEVLVDSSAISF